MVYISKQQILTRFRRYKALNETRLQRTCALMGPQARWGLEVVPLLLHYNHICLPGYRSGYIPHGIDLFTPNEIQQQYLRSQLSESLSEAYDEMAQLPAQSAAEAQERLEYEARNAELLAQIPPLEEPVQHDILGLYAMGSTSSIGQSQSSDLDIWVCVRANISAEGMSALQDKCRFITTYVKSQGVELNLFVTPEDRFTNFQPDQLDEENCGSAQNLFLLDEFYRSSIRLCGRYIIWYLISTKEEQSAYQDYVNFLLEGRSNLPHFVPRLPVTLATVGLDPAPAPASASVSAQSSAQGLSHGGSHGISQGVSQGISQGVSQGVSQGISQGVSQGMSHGSSHGMSHVMMSDLIGDDESYRWYNQHALEHLMELPDPNDEEGDDEEVAADAAAADEAAADAFALEAASADPTPRERERPLRRIKGWYHKLAGKAESAERADSELSAAAVPEGGPAQSEWSEVTPAQAALPEATVASPEQAGPAAETQTSDAQTEAETGAASSGEIGSEAAFAIALENAGVPEGDAYNVKVEPDRENDISIWQVEFETDYGDYDFEIAVDGGRIIGADYEVDEEWLDFLGGSPVDEDGARAAVAGKVDGASADEVQVWEKSDDGRVRYEGELYHDGIKYEFELDGQTGILFDWNADMRE